MIFNSRRLMVAALLAGLLLGADTLVWLQMQRLLEHRLHGLIQDAAGSGWQLEAAGEQRGGWPFAADLTLAAPRLHGAGALLPGGLTWSGERVTVTLSPLHPRRIAIAASGIQTVSAGGSGSRTGSLRNSLRLRGARTVLRVPAASPDGIGHASFDAAALQLALPGAGPDEVETIAGLRGTLRWTRQAHALTLVLRGIGLPHGDGVTPDTVIPDADLELSVVGTPNGEGSVAERLRAWRAAGGRLLLRQAAARWNDASVEVGGQAVLGANLQPDGAFTVRIAGADAVLDKLARSGRINPPTVSAVRAVLGLISAARGGPGGDTLRPLELPLALHDGLLSLGEIPLLRIPVPALPGDLP